MQPSTTKYLKHITCHWNFQIIVFIQVLNFHWSFVATTSSSSWQHLRRDCAGYDLPLSDGLKLTYGFHEL